MNETFLINFPVILTISSKTRTATIEATGNPHAFKFKTATFPRKKSKWHVTSSIRAVKIRDKFKREFERGPPEGREKRTDFVEDRQVKA